MEDNKNKQSTTRRTRTGKKRKTSAQLDKEMEKTYYKDKINTLAIFTTPLASNIGSTLNSSYLRTPIKRKERNEGSLTDYPSLQNQYFDKIIEEEVRFEETKTGQIAFSFIRKTDKTDTIITISGDGISSFLGNAPNKLRLFHYVLTKIFPNLDRRSGRLRTEWIILSPKELVEDFKWYKTVKRAKDALLNLIDTLSLFRWRSSITPYKKTILSDNLKGNMPPFIGYVPGDKGAIKLRLDNELTNWNVLLWYYIPVPEVVFEGTKGKLDAFLINIVGNMRMRAKDVKKDDKGKLYLEFTIRIDEISKAIGLPTVEHVKDTSENLSHLYRLKNVFTDETDGLIVKANEQFEKGGADSEVHLSLDQDWNTKRCDDDEHPRQRLTTTEMFEKNAYIKVTARGNILLTLQDIKGRQEESKRIIRAKKNSRKKTG